MGAREELGRQLWSDPSHGWSLLYQCQEKNNHIYIVENYGEGVKGEVAKIGATAVYGQEGKPCPQY